MSSTDWQCIPKECHEKLAQTIEWGLHERHTKHAHQIQIHLTFALGFVKNDDREIDNSLHSFPMDGLALAGSIILRLTCRSKV